ncbi:cellulose biosynthesis protein BcsF [Oceanimonas marisflavi]|uniref:cellulose biosynthesis protein BcsF n=1 Tax=Oceanimonas marisflavi TaxID=2059724 RepID=UPI000D3159EC|nr:cellulose biosynthesis protein BcsF [Oceanimonas marisflavi]
MYSDVWQLALLSALLALTGWWALTRLGRKTMALIALLLPGRYLKARGVRRVIRKEECHEQGGGRHDPD